MTKTQDRPEEGTRGRSQEEVTSKGGAARRDQDEMPNRDDAAENTAEDIGDLE